MVSTLKPTVGIVFSVSSNFNLYKIVDFPAITQFLMNEILLLKNPYLSRDQVVELVNHFSPISTGSVPFLQKYV